MPIYKLSGLERALFKRISPVPKPISKIFLLCLFNFFILQKDSIDSLRKFLSKTSFCLVVNGLFLELKIF